MTIVWTNPARRDIHVIIDYLAERSPNAAKHVHDVILKAVERLAEFPYSGRPGQLVGTRELVTPRYPYIIMYGVREPDAIVIYHVHHGAQNWQEREEE